MKIFDKVKGLFVETIEEDEDTNIENQSGGNVHEHFAQKKPFSSSSTPTSNVVNIPFSPAHVKVVIVEPVKFDDAQKIADSLRNDEPVIVNFEKTDNDVVKRITDFVTGTIYAIGGNIQTVGNDILLCAPRSVDISSAGLTSGFIRKSDFGDLNKESTSWKDK